MATGELDMLMATLMLDGRYQDSCFKFPCSISSKLTEAFHLYVRFKKMMTIKSNEKMTPQDQKKLIIKALGQPQEQISSEYHSHVNDLLVWTRSTAKTIGERSRPARYTRGVGTVLLGLAGTGTYQTVCWIQGYTHARTSYW